MSVREVFQRRRFVPRSFLSVREAPAWRQVVPRSLASVREDYLWRWVVPRSLSISLGIRKAIFYQPKLSGAPAFAPRNATNVVARGGHPAATFLIKRKWPKIDRGGPRAPSEAKGSGGGLRLGPPLVSWPVPSLRSPPGKAVGSSAKRQASRGARQPGRAGARSH